MLDDLITSVPVEHWFYGPSQLSNYPQRGPFVYFIQSGETIKIGCSGTPELRVDQLRRGGKAHRPSAGLSPTIRLLAYIEGGYELEKRLHTQFSDSLDRGEWFFITDELTALVNQSITEQAHVEIFLHNAYYQWAVGAHGWPDVTFDLGALEEKRIHSIATEQDWQWMDEPNPAFTTKAA